MNHSLNNVDKNPRDANSKILAIEELATERGNTGGLVKRIDENRELLELLQERVPQFVSSHPWLVGWIQANDNFFTQLEGILETHQALCMPKDLLKSKDPVGAMSLSFKNNWIIILSVGVFGSLTFAGALYSINVIKHDVKKMISVAENVFQGIAYVDEKNFGFPPASEMAQYVPDSPLLKDYEQCAKNPKVLMRLLKNELSKEITIRDYSKTITAWPFPLGYIIYNGDFPSGPYTYGFVFGKTFEDKSYQLKDLIVFIPVEESKRKERVIQHLTLIDSLCRDQ